jgi:hypothetical protein
MFIFFHLYKCGGNSVRKVLPKDMEWQGVHCLPRDAELYYATHSKQEKFKEMFKFTFVRNPFNFLLSTFYYATIFKNHFMHNDIKGMDMGKFVEYYMKVVEEHKDPTIRPFGSNKVTTLYEYITDKDGRVIVDFVGKLENINAHMNVVLHKVGLPPLAEPMPVKNKTATKEGHYRTHYSVGARKLVEKHFEKDLNYFNYEF